MDDLKDNLQAGELQNPPNTGNTVFYPGTQPFLPMTTLPNRQTNMPSNLYSGQVTSGK